MVEVSIDGKIQRLEEELADINSELEFYKYKKLYLIQLGIKLQVSGNTVENIMKAMAQSH